MLEELWVPVEGFPNYEVSNYGRVVNVNTGRDLKPQVKKSGDLQVKLFVNGVATFWYVRRLVARAFFLNYSEVYNVLLINGIKTDCTVANIQIDMIHEKRGPRSG